MLIAAHNHASVATVRALLAVFLVAGTAGCPAATPVENDSGLADASLDAEPIDASTDTSIDGTQPPPCGTLGATKSAPCGNCGSGTLTCAPNGWTLTACTGRGECAAGSVEEDHLFDCSARERTCSATCTWGAWTPTVAANPSRECDYGSAQAAPTTCSNGQQAHYPCDPTTCMWSTTPSVCGGGCPADSTRRISPAWAEEICIPDGYFQRYYNVVRELVRFHVSAHFIDRYPVTFRRYQACVDAGQCTALEPLLNYFGPGLDLIDSSAHPDAPVWSATFEQGRDFCEWDGGRRMPTEAEFMQFVVGPGDAFVSSTPRFKTDCEAIPCGTIADMNVVGRIYEDYNARPHATHYWGVELFQVHFPEWSTDWFNDNTRWFPPNDVDDPQGPASGNPADARGSVGAALFHMTLGTQPTDYGGARSGYGSTFCNLPGSSYQFCDGMRGVSAIRCARSAE